MKPAPPPAPPTASEAPAGFTTGAPTPALPPPAPEPPMPKPLDTSVWQPSWYPVMKRLSVMGDSPPTAVAVADKVTKPSREVVAAARLGTELICSASMEMDRFHPSRVC